MAQGTVKWFDEKKGYGFITAPDGGPDIFVHYSGIQGEGFKTLKEGEAVEFNMVVSEKGPKAENVVRLSPPAVPQTPVEAVTEPAVPAPLATPEATVPVVPPSQAPTDVPPPPPA